MQDATLLMALVTGLYLYDSALLLYRNEGILRPDSNGNWAVQFGFDDTRILGKDIYIPNPFLPHRPLFRLSWAFAGAAGEAGENWAADREAFAALAPMVWGVAIALFVCLPLGFFTPLADKMLVSGIVLLYLSIFAALLWVWLHRQVLHVSEKRFAGIAFECVVCPPFALNLIRGISLKIPVGEDLVHASRRLQNPGEWRATCDRFLKRLDEEMEGEELDSDRMKAMQAHRRTLIERM